MAFRYSFNTWAFSSFPTWLPAYPFEYVVDALGTIGYDAVEIGCASPIAFPAYLSAERRREMANILTNRKLAVSSLLPAPGGGPGYNVASPYAVERDDAVAQYKAVVDLASDLAAPTVIYVAGWVVFGSSAVEARKWSADALHDIARYAEPRGIRLAVEPTSADSNLIETADDVLEIIAEVGQDNVGAMFDTFHVAYRSERAVDYVERLRDVLIHVHIAHADRKPPQAGSVDYLGLLRSLRQISYPGYVTMEIGFTDRKVDPTFYARQSLDYLRGLEEQL
jgi:protein FrlC